jgi:hypothetical protein
MKKLILLIIFCCAISCGRSKSEKVVPVDSLQFYEDTLVPILPSPLVQDPAIDKDLIAEATIINFDIQNIVQKKDTIQKDTIKSKKSLTITKLDTVSVLPEIRKNMEVMKYQQKQLDSLLYNKKRK